MATADLAYDREASKLIEEALEQEETVSDNTIKYILFVFASVATIIVFFIIVFLFLQGGSFFGEYNIFKFLSGDIWYATQGYFGALPMIMGTLLTTLGAMIISIPLSVLTAIFIAELAPPRLSKYLKLGVELLSGIPSVVFGYFGFVIFNIWVRDIFGLNSGSTWFSGSVILAVMALPTITSVCEDSIRSVPRSYKEASLAMGATKWQTIQNVILPAAMSGIAAAIILGIGRAIGETMALLMITGNCMIIPDPITNMFTCVRTITAAIGLEMGETPQGSLHRKALFALGIILFMMTLFINVIANIILNRINKKFRGEIEEKSEGKIRSNATFKRVKAFLSHYKGLILKGIVLTFIGWVLTTWIGLFNAILVILIIIGLMIIMRSISAETQQKVWYGIIGIAALIVLTVLFIIIYYIVVRGLPALMTPGFLTEFPRDSSTAGGILPAIWGTILLTIGSVLFSVPIGLLAGIYLSEYAKDGKITRVIRAGIDNLNGTPSIVFGLFGYMLFVLYFGAGISVIAGQLTLALMILPTIIRTTEEAVSAIPQSFREGSLALGSSKWQSIVKVVLPAATPGIVTGIVLGMGRAAGETAPIIFTAAVFTTRHLTFNPFDPIMALSNSIYILTTNILGGHEYAGGCALVLLFIVLILYGIAFIIRNRYQKKKVW
jgi:phosphate transport system permease protein